MREVRIPSTPEEWSAWEEEFRRSMEHSREAILARMGYSSYEDYLRGKLWKAIRSRVFQRDKGCVRCRGASQEVHHMSYSEPVLRGECDEELVALCEGCHDFVEFDDDGTARSDAEKRHLAQSADTRADYPRPKIDLRRSEPVYPPEWKRMNARQREGWRNEYSWVWYNRKHPQRATEPLDVLPKWYVDMKTAYERTKGNVRDVASPTRKPKSKA
jgi:hypothetical protein